MFHCHRWVPRSVDHPFLGTFRESIIVCWKIAHLNSRTSIVSSQTSLIIKGQMALLHWFYISLTKREYAWMTKSNRQHPPAGNWRIHTAGDVGNFQKSSEIKKMYSLVISSKIVQPFCERWGFAGRRAHLWQHGAASQHVELQGLKVTLRTLRTLRGMEDDTYQHINL